MCRSNSGWIVIFGGSQRIMEEAGGFFNRNFQPAGPILRPIPAV